MFASSRPARGESEPLVPEEDAPPLQRSTSHPETVGCAPLPTAPACADDVETDPNDDEGHEGEDACEAQRNAAVAVHKPQHGAEVSTLPEGYQLRHVAISAFLTFLPLFMGYSALTKFQKKIKQRIGITDNKADDDLSYLFGVAVSFYYVGMLLFRVGHNFIFFWLAPKKRALVAYAVMWCVASCILGYYYIYDGKSIPLIFVIYFCGGGAVATFEPNMMSVLTPFGPKVKSFAAIGIPSGVGGIGIGAFSLFSAFPEGSITGELIIISVWVGMTMIGFGVLLFTVPVVAFDPLSVAATVHSTSDHSAAAKPSQTNDQVPRLECGEATTTQHDPIATTSMNVTACEESATGGRGGHGSPPPFAGKASLLLFWHSLKQWRHWCSWEFLGYMLSFAIDELTVAFIVAVVLYTFDNDQIRMWPPTTPFEWMWEGNGEVTGMKSPSNHSTLPWTPTTTTSTMPPISSMFTTAINDTITNWTSGVFTSTTLPPSKNDDCPEGAHCWYINRNALLATNYFFGFSFGATSRRLAYVYFKRRHAAWYLIFNVLAVFCIISKVAILGPVGLALVMWGSGCVYVSVLRYVDVCIAWKYNLIALSVLMLGSDIGSIIGANVVFPVRAAIGRVV